MAEYICVYSWGIFVSPKFPFGNFQITFLTLLSQYVVVFHKNNWAVISFAPCSTNSKREFVWWMRVCGIWPSPLLRQTNKVGFIKRTSKNSRRRYINYEETKLNKTWGGKGNINNNYFKNKLIFSHSNCSKKFGDLKYSGTGSSSRPITL